jgi:hybrid cluster-associated redox disulfide protein
MKVTKDTIIAEVLRINPKTAVLFMEIGMHCVGCPSASGESIEQACMVHGADPDELVEKINKFLEQ